MSAKLNYATLIFPPPRSPAYEAQSYTYNADTNSHKELVQELPFERTLIALNSKEYEFIDSELDLYCDGGSSNSSSDSYHGTHVELKDPSPVEGEW